MKLWKLALLGGAAFTAGIVYTIKNVQYDVKEERFQLRILRGTITWSRPGMLIEGLRFEPTSQMTPETIEEYDRMLDDRLAFDEIVKNETDDEETEDEDQDNPDKDLD